MIVACSAGRIRRSYEHHNLSQRSRKLVPRSSIENIPDRPRRDCTGRAIEPKLLDTGVSPTGRAITLRITHPSRNGHYLEIGKFGKLAQIAGRHVTACSINLKADSSQRCFAKKSFPWPT